MLKKLMNKFNKKGFIISPMLGYLLIALGVLLVMVIVYGIITGKLSNTTNYIKNLFRFKF
tara:strand:- start:38 stop:217 length:180 start_codon:yes stop_codon:yes gene_type:complete